MADHVSIPDTLAKFGVGLAGAFVSLRFVQGSLWERFLMTIGGAFLSYTATTPTAKWLGMSDAEGMVGFLIGLLGMALMAKVYETIQTFAAPELSRALLEKLRKFLGG